MKINNIKFANHLKIMIYQLFLNEYKIKDINTLENLFEEKFLNGKSIDEIKDKNIIEINNKKISIRDLYINLGNNIVRYGKLKEFIQENQQNLKIVKKEINKYSILLEKNYIIQEELFEKKILNSLFGLNENEKLINCSLLSIEEIKKNFKKIIEDFIIKYIDIIKYSNDIWTDITFKNLNNKELNIFTDTRFLTELEKIKQIKHQTILIIKLKNNKLSGEDIKEENLNDFYNLYTKSKSLKDFVKQIEEKKLVKNAEELSTVLTFHFYIKYYKKNYILNSFIDKDIEKENIKVLWNKWGDLDNLTKTSLEILKDIINKNINNIILIANRKSGKDTILKILEEYNIENTINLE